MADIPGSGSAGTPVHCPQCDEVMLDPRLLPCGHTFCRQPCLENLKERCCPDCKSPFFCGVSELPINESVQGVIESLKKSDGVSNSIDSPSLSASPVGSAGISGLLGSVMGSDLGEAHSLDTFSEGLNKRWGPREIKVLREVPLTKGCVVRVVAVRHGLGHHNLAGGSLSFVNRDAELTEVGIAQARMAGADLRAAGLFENDQMIVVTSPFTRTLQTTIGLIGKKSWTHRTYVQPLAAENSFIRSALQRGDRGSTRAELEEKFPPATYRSFDFTGLDEYCKIAQAETGKWWHHGPAVYKCGIYVGTFEEGSSFSSRAKQLRVWLASEAKRVQANTILLVSHGGILREAFSTPQFDNGEFRVFDLTATGVAHRVSQDGVVATDEKIGGWEYEETIHLEIEKVVYVLKNGKYYYITTGKLHGVPFTVERRLSDYRSILLRNAHKVLSDSEYPDYFTTSFPSQSLFWTQLEPWLKCLAALLLEAEKIFLNSEENVVALQEILQFFESNGLDRTLALDPHAQLEVEDVSMTKLNGEIFYTTTGTVGGTNFKVTRRLSDYRARLHVPMKRLPPDLYRKLFPVSFPGLQMWSDRLKPWLACLCRALDNPGVPTDDKHEILCFFLHDEEK